MKKYLLAVGLFILTLSSKAQTMTFPDMVDLGHLNNDQLYATLIATGRYRVNTMAQVNGQDISYYEVIDRNKQVVKGETLVTGAYHTADHDVRLHTFTYQTTYADYVYNLMAQMTKDGYSLTFRGNDASKHIYIYDNQFTHVTIFIPFYHGTSSVEIREKDVSKEI